MLSPAAFKQFPLRVYLPAASNLYALFLPASPDKLIPSLVTVHDVAESALAVNNKESPLRIVKVLPDSAIISVACQVIAVVLVIAPFSNETDALTAEFSLRAMFFIHLFAARTIADSELIVVNFGNSAVPVKQNGETREVIVLSS